MLRRLLRIVILAGMMLVPAADAMAQRGIVPVQGPGLRAACMPDYLRYCRGVFGRGRIILCLNTYADQLSQPCFQALTLRGLEFATMLKACGPDFNRLCGGIPRGPRGNIACLLQHAEALSPACREILIGEEFDEPLPPRGPPR